MVKVILLYPCVRPTQSEAQMTKTELDEETQILKNAARQMFGPDVILTPVVLEGIREMYRLRMADTALNGETA